MALLFVKEANPAPCDVAELLTILDFVALKEDLSHRMPPPSIAELFLTVVPDMMRDPPLF